MGERRAMWGRGGRCGREEGDVGERRAMWGRGERCGEEEGDVGERRVMWGIQASEEEERSK